MVENIIKIGNVLYTINYCDIRKELLTDDYGYCDFSYKNIYVDNKFRKDATEQILFHEITHALLNESNLRNWLVDNEFDEEFTDRFSKILYKFIKDNYISKEK